jgi:hypothetical protein
MIPPAFIFYVSFGFFLMNSAFSMRINYAAMQKGHACIFKRFSKPAASSNLHFVAKEKEAPHACRRVYIFVIIEYYLLLLYSNHYLFIHLKYNSSSFLYSL